MARIVFRSVRPLVALALSIHLAFIRERLKAHLRRLPWQQMGRPFGWRRQTHKEKLEFTLSDNPYKPVLLLEAVPHNPCGRRDLKLEWYDGARVVLQVEFTFFPRKTGGEYLGVIRYKTPKQTMEIPVDQSITDLASKAHDKAQTLLKFGR